MAKLTPEEQAQLDALTEKANAKDEPRGGNVSIHIDLSDAAAVKRAMKLGLIDAADLDDDDDGDDGDGDDGDGDGDGDGDDDEKPDAAPRRRLSLADRTMGAK